MTPSNGATTQYLSRPGGRLGYDDQGSGPLVVLVPGMGDPRSTFRFQVGPLVDAGMRVVSMDLRGHGDSDATFDAYDDEALASDLIALVEHVGGPASVVGNSMGAGAAVIAAAERPELFTRLALVGAFVRNPSAGKATLALFRALTTPPVVRAVWRLYLPTLYAGQKPADFKDYLRQVRESLARPGHARAFSRTTRTTHAPAEAAAPKVVAPVLVLMGSRDPDFPDPSAEGLWIAGAVGGVATARTIDDTGHYPHAQRPDVVNPALVEFLTAGAPGA